MQLAVMVQRYCKIKTQLADEGPDYLLHSKSCLRARLHLRLRHAIKA